MEEVLNPLLYRKLKRHFGRVRVSNPGQAMSAASVKDPYTKRPKLSIQHPGEYYQVCCPYCDDTKFRLYVNHMYGQPDAYRRRMTFLAICYNETACMTKPDNQRDFLDTLEEIEGVLERAKVKPGEEVSLEARVADWPGPCVPIDQLKDKHKAREYLRSRHFDPDYIAKRFDVRWCLDSHFFLARKRLIIPVYDKGKLRGWQARLPEDLDWKNKELNLPPKYFTMPGMPRRLLLYNFDRAKEWETGVVMEGPTDVWSLGSMGICTFGATMTPHQQRRFVTVFRKRSAVLLFDPEEFEAKATRKLVEKLEKKLPTNLAKIKLPEGTDPGSLDREFLRDYIASEASKQGVKVRFRRVKK
jgi:uncharacterized protein YueI